MANVQIAQASIDENKSARGGQSGDQTGGETNVRNWYQRSGGWKELIRCKDESVAKKAADAIVKLTKSNFIGYDQNQRNTLYAALKKNGWSVDKYIESGEPVETDCSAYVYSVYCCFVPSLRSWCDSKGNSAYCGNLWSVFSQYGDGLFERYDDYNIINSNEYLKVGDLLNDPSHHTVMVVSTDGSIPITVAPSNEYTSTSTSRSSSSSNYSNTTVSSNSSNTVYRLSAATKPNENVLQQTEMRKSEFESLRNKMTNEAPDMGRDIIHTSELYDTNILKSDQEAKKERF